MAAVLATPTRHVVALAKIGSSDEGGSAAKTVAPVWLASTPSPIASVISPNAIALAKLQLRAKIKSCMKHYAKILFSIFTAMICAMAFAADQPACQKTGKIAR